MLVVRSLAHGVGRPWSLRTAVLAGVGGALGIGTVALLGLLSGAPLLIAPMGSTCMMLFGAPQAPFAQPRNVLGGHLICTVVGLVAVSMLGAAPWAIGVAVGFAMAVMGLTRSFHPPAGGDTVLVMLVQPSWLFLFAPVLLGCVVLLGIALLFHNAHTRGSYPVLEGGPEPHRVVAPGG
ncbi:HPP family protein [Micromonospora radicis]|uniref:HPP family protein n=1 Tax=Micromonospora radicis TaxID=1894971 RepID=UPI00131438A6|nr:HPP family protein [Micromonospora radicis]